MLHTASLDSPPSELGFGGGLPAGPGPPTGTPLRPGGSRSRRSPRGGRCRDAHDRDPSPRARAGRRARGRSSSAARGGGRRPRPDAGVTGGVGGVDVARSSRTRNSRWSKVALKSPARMRTSPRQSAAGSAPIASLPAGRGGGLMGGEGWTALTLTGGAPGCPARLRAARAPRRRAQSGCARRGDRESTPAPVAPTRGSTAREGNGCAPAAVEPRRSGGRSSCTLQHVHPVLACDPQHRTRIRTPEQRFEVIATSRGPCRIGLGHGHRSGGTASVSATAATAATPPSEPPPRQQPPRRAAASAAPRTSCSQRGPADPGTRADHRTRAHATRGAATPIATTLRTARNLKKTQGGRPPYLRARS